jgi:long-chain acyl-CoA synthetase
VASQPDSPRGHAPAPDPGGPAISSPFSGNVADLVADAAARSPEHPALLEPAVGLVLSWSRVQRATLAEAARLREAGVTPGDRVLIRLGHGVGFCVAVLGALRAGAVAVPVGTQSTQRELTAILADCGPAALVVEESDEAAGYALRSVASTLPGTSRLPPPKVPVTEHADAGDGGDALEPPDSGRGGEDIALLGYTSGVTGRPRGVCLSHRALLANRAQIALLRPVPVSPADRVLLQLPLFHIYGLGAGLLQVCWAGATGVLVARLDAEELIEAVRQQRVTVLSGVPSTYRTLLELPLARLREGLVTVRLCIAGGAPLPPELPPEFERGTGLALFNGYGLTETGPVLTSTLVGGAAKPGSVGRPLPGGPGVPGVELRLVDPDGTAGVGTDTTSGPDADLDDEPDTGLVSVRGPNLFSGYWPDGAGGPDGGGWFRTSDVGVLDADGDLNLVDRATDVVIVNGFNVYPHEVEQVLEEHPAVAEAAVVGVPDPRTGEAVKAVLVVRPGAKLRAEQVREHSASRLARFKRPVVIEFAERLPRSATGKIVRRELRSDGGDD